jgi:hypothetical protein
MSHASLCNHSLVNQRKHTLGLGTHQLSLWEAAATHLFDILIHDVGRILGVLLEVLLLVLWRVVSGVWLKHPPRASRSASRLPARNHTSRRNHLQQHVDSSPFSHSRSVSSQRTGRIKGAKPVCPPRSP